MLRDLRFEEHFLFTQFSLNTFKNCPLKFKKRYLENLKWSSFPEESIRKGIEQGKIFHLLAQRYFLGVDPGLEGAVLEFSELQGWMKTLADAFSINSGWIYLPEYKIRMVSQGLKLEANYDLIIIKEDHLEIWDWKTGQRGRQTSYQNINKQLSESLQTVVYLFVLREQVSKVLHRNIPADRIVMKYWQPEKPYILAEITYREDLHEKFRKLLKAKIEEILSYDYQTFDQSRYEKHCKLCEFNWFCNNERIDFDRIRDEENLLDELNWNEIEEMF